MFTVCSREELLVATPGFLTVRAVFAVLDTEGPDLLDFIADTWALLVFLTREDRRTLVVGRVFSLEIELCKVPGEVEAACKPSCGD